MILELINFPAENIKYLKFHKLSFAELSELYFLQTCRRLKHPKMRLFFGIFTTPELELLRRVRVLLIDRLPYVSICLISCHKKSNPKIILWVCILVQRSVAETKLDGHNFHYVLIRTKKFDFKTIFGWLSGRDLGRDLVPK